MTKILLVEDDKSLREIYGVRLLAEGYDIVSAGDGEEALAMAIKERPQLIVSDVMMPKISGFDMLDILRSTTETRDIKVIMMTALSSEDQRQRGEQLGADRYLVKSQVGIEDVVRTVHEVLGDAPVTQNSFVNPAPAPQQPAQQPQPAAPSVAPQPQQPDTPAPQTPAPALQQPAQQPQPAAPSVAPQPQQPDTPAPQQPLPQPTAPFSSPRPATLGERVIQPVSAPDQSTDDFASRIAAELSGVTAQDAPQVSPEQTTPDNTPTPEQAQPQQPTQSEADTPSSNQPPVA